MKLSTSVLCSALLLLTCTRVQADWMCWSCPESEVGKSFSCADPNNDYYGDLITCTPSNTAAQEACYKRLDKNGNVYRGCVPKDDDVDHPSPWDNGWESKNRCKTKDGIKYCTCKTDNGRDMCNSAGHVMATMALTLTALAIAKML